MKLKVLLLLLVLSASLAGCIRTEPGVQANIGFNGELRAENSFRMDGYLSVGGGISPKDEYRNISVNYYDENKSLEHRENLGTLHVGEQLQYSHSREQPPKYIIIESEDFWVDNVAVRYYELTDEGWYTGQWAADKEDLPVYEGGLFGIF